MQVTEGGLASIGVVVTSYQQGEQVAEAVQSVYAQTRVPVEVIVVDDGSTDEATHLVLKQLQPRATVLKQPNAGVAAARNNGIRSLGTNYVAVLDGDDQWEPTFLERTTALLESDGHCIAASSWLQMFGVATHLVEPAGGTLVDFLHRNACPASAVFRRSAWELAGGYRETMRAGFEDWDFFLSLLEQGGRIEIVPAPLLRYRTHPSSLNVTSMADRLNRFREIISGHRAAYQDHLLEALLALEATSIERLTRWEHLLEQVPDAPEPTPRFGDGGMAASVRIASARRAT